MLESIKDGQVVKHLKTGNLYTVIHSEVITATNGREDEVEVIYTRTDGSHEGRLFAREISQFKEKFELTE